MSNAITGTKEGALEVIKELDNATTGSFLDESQRAFALNRLNDLAEEQFNVYVDKHPAPYSYRPELSPDDRVKQIRDGVAKLIDMEKIKKVDQLPFGNETAWNAMFVFVDTAEQKEYDAWQADIDSMDEAICNARDAAVDAIMLGGGSDAAAMLRTFGPDAEDPRKVPLPA